MWNILQGAQLRQDLIKVSESWNDSVNLRGDAWAAHFVLVYTVYKKHKDSAFSCSFTGLATSL